MKKFTRISIVDPVKITDEAKVELQSLSDADISYPASDAKNLEEAIERISDADAILGNWQSTINSSILQNTPNLKYIGICGTSLANIDTQAVEQKGIVLKNVTDYGDEGVAEYIFVQLLNLFRGFGKHQWRDEACELNGKTIGIVGLGATGQQVARVALGFKMNVLYFSNSRKPEWEEKGVTYTPFHELLRESDIISLHVPKNTKILGKSELEIIGDGKIITDTCLGVVYMDFESVREWLGRADNYLIHDHNPEIYEKLGDMDRYIYTEGVIAGITMEARDRLSEKVLKNITEFLNTP